MAPGQDGNSDTKERVPRDALFLFVHALPAPGGSCVDPAGAAHARIDRAGLERLHRCPISLGSRFAGPLLPPTLALVVGDC